MNPSATSTSPTTITAVLVTPAPCIWPAMSASVPRSTTCCGQLAKATTAAGFQPVAAVEKLRHDGIDLGRGQVQHQRGAGAGEGR